MTWIRIKLKRKKMMIHLVRFKIITHNKKPLLIDIKYLAIGPQQKSIYLRILLHRIKNY